jgi:hypothetical protein
MAQEKRQSNISMGNKPAQFETSHRATYGLERLNSAAAQTGLNSDVKKELRKAHFQFGSQQLTYDTTN